MIKHRITRIFFRLKNYQKKNINTKKKKKKNENKNQTKNRGKNRHLFAQRISKILCRNLGTDKPLILEKHQVFSTKLISQTDLIHSVSFWNKGQSAKLSNSQALLSTLKGFYGEESETR